MEIKPTGRPVEFPVLTGAEAANWDKFSISEKKIDSRLLMGWAGYALFSWLFKEPWYENARQIHILAGTGNNGGDGYVLAWHLLSATKKTLFVWQSGAPQTEDAGYFASLCNDPAFQNRLYLKTIEEITIQDTGSANTVFQKGNIVVDAVFGTGLNKPPAESLSKIFTKINAVDDIIRVAVDIPSGVYANGDVYDHEVFQAHHTCSFGSYKVGHLVEPGIIDCGKLTILPIGFFPVDFNRDDFSLLQNKNRKRVIAPLELKDIPELRKSGGHKYTSGVVTILGGSPSMEGAALMSARAFLSCGGGLAKIFTPADSLKQALAESPELMIHADPEMDRLEKAFLDSIKGKGKNHVAIIGPGLQETLSANFWKELFSTGGLSVVIDGSGLGQLPGLLASSENIFQNHGLRRLILTPHRGEAEKLLGKKIANVRLAALEISQKYNAHVYLKGPGGILVLQNQNDLENDQKQENTFTEEIYLASRHHELSTGGTGDVLCGVIANMLCRYDLNERGEKKSEEGIEAALNVYLAAAEAVVRSNMNNQDFLTPSELIAALRLVISPPPEEC